MTNLINQITINGETTTFLNYVNPVVGGVVTQSEPSWTSLLTTQFGVDTTKWVKASNYKYYALRFPVPWETLTGNISNPSDWWFNAPLTGARMSFAYSQATYCSTMMNSNNGTGLTQIDTGADAVMNGSYQFAVINNHALTCASFAGIGRTGTALFYYFGWLKDGQYVGSSFPRNLALIGQYNKYRVQTENTTSTQAALIQNPALSCSVVTPGANSTDVLFQDSTAPNNYIGKLWNMMVLPSSAVVGKIYRNTGIDPDTGVVETDQKAYWMCVGSWGTDKIGMRVWTENIT